MLHHNIHHVPIVDQASGNLNKAIPRPRVRALRLVAFSCLVDCGDNIGNARRMNLVKCICLFGMFRRLMLVTLYCFRKSPFCRVVGGRTSSWLARTLLKALGCTQERLGSISAVPGREPRMRVNHGLNSVMEPRRRVPRPQASYFSSRSLLLRVDMMRMEKNVSALWSFE